MFDKSLLKRAIDALDACTTDEGPESFELSASRKILAELRAAHAAPVAPAEPPTITLSGAQLLEALDFVAPDRDRPDQLDQLESEVCISHRPAGIDTDGDPFEAGMCCWLSDYPEEGAIPLPGRIPTAPAAPAEQPVDIMSRATYTTSSGAGHKALTLYFDELHDAEQVRLWAQTCGTKARPAAPVAPAEPLEHVCGLQGFGAIGDFCPACRADANDRSEKGAAA